MSNTKLTTASIRIALSHSYSTFEIALNLENPDGINTEDVAAARVTAQALANDALNEYKRQPNANVKDEIKRVENKIQDIKKMVAGPDEELKSEPVVDPKEVARVESLPLYGETKAAKEANKPKSKATKPTKVQSLLEQAINGKL